MWGTEFQFTDEIYQYRNYDPKSVRVLLSLNMEKCSPKMPYLVPLVAVLVLCTFWPPLTTFLPKLLLGR